jgi:putative ABC transport system substrate-binding protein
MQRREFIVAIGGAAAFPLAARVQHSRHNPVVGVLWPDADAEAAGASRLGLLKGLAELGYIPGRTFMLEERYANDVPSAFKRSCCRVDRPQSRRSGQPS